MLEYALEKANLINSGGKQRIYAVAVDRKGRVLAEAYNQYQKSHPKQFYYAAKTNNDRRVFLHAEMLCIIRALKTGKKIKTLYVARAGQNGQAMLASPCPVCTLMLQTEFPDVKIVHT